MELSQLVDLTPAKLLIALERATRARYRYVHLCNAEGKHVDIPVEHQLTNYMMLLQDLAQAVGLDSDEVVAAMQRGTETARTEARANA